MDIKLNFINDSNDVNNSEIVIFAKNEATDVQETAVAWQVIRNCGRGDNHPFVYPMMTQVGASDSWGNLKTPRLAPPLWGDDVSSSRRRSRRSPCRSTILA
jgi:hypothetical protein